MTYLELLTELRKHGATHVLRLNSDLAMVYRDRNGHIQFLEIAELGQNWSAVNGWISRDPNTLPAFLTPIMEPHDETT